MLDEQYSKIKIHMSSTNHFIFSQNFLSYFLFEIILFIIGETNIHDI